VPLPPGTTFGPFAGAVRGGPCDLTRADAGLLFATPGACERLESAGVALPARGPARLRGRTPTDFLEFDVPPGGRLATAGYALRAPAPCATCGRWDRTLQRLLLEPGSVPPGADLVRPTNHPTVLLASERLVSAVRGAELTGLTFQPVHTASAET